MSENGEETRSNSLTEIVSEGFAAPSGNEDPFIPISGLITPPSKSNLNVAGASRPVPPTKTSIADQTKTGILQVISSLKILKGPRKSLSEGTRSFALEGLPTETYDPDEEKLKLLSDCCELTKGQGYIHEWGETKKEMSSAWFSKINLTSNIRKHLCFAESLLIMEENGTVVGKMYCNVTASKWGTKNCLCIHSGSSGKFSTGLETGTSITSFVNFRMQPLQEYVHEWATKGSESMERKTLLLTDEDTMTCKITSFHDGYVVHTKNIQLGTRDRENLVTEGSNILLQRLLVYDKRTTGSMILQSIYYTGQVVRCKYTDLGCGWENVRGEKVKTWGIRRLVNITHDEERQWDSLFNKQSRLILRCQPDSPQALIPLWFESIIEFDRYGKFIGVVPPYAWACDADFYSKYSMKKEELSHNYRLYMNSHPEVRALLSDYLQSILFRKPQNVLEFTKEYFDAYLNLPGKSKPTKQKDASTDSKMSDQYSSSYSSENVSGVPLEGGGQQEGENAEDEVIEGEEILSRNAAETNLSTNYDDDQDMDGNEDYDSDGGSSISTLSLSDL